MRTPRASLLVAASLALAAARCTPARNGFVDTGPGADAAADDVAPGEDAPGEDGEATPDVATTDAVIDPPVDSGPPASEDLVTGGAPADSAARFGGADAPALAPTVVYPSDGTIVPPNLAGLEVHFRPAAGTDLFMVSFEGTGGGGRVRVFTRCTAAGDGCALALDAATMRHVARASRPGGAVRLVVAGVGADGRVGRAAPRELGITATDLRGGVYYWAATAASIVRYEFGLAGARPETYLRGDPFNCVGCHALSRDGSRTAVGRGIPMPARTRVYDTATRGAGMAEFGSNFSSFAPDNSRLIVSDGQRLTLLDGNGAPAAGLPPGAAGTMPDWSPDGSRVVFVVPAATAPLGGSPGHDGRADLFTMPYTGGAFRSATALLRSTGENNYYPSFSPDGQWVIFNRSAVTSYDAVDAHLWAIPAGGGAPVRLARADGTGDLSNSWPRWAPFRQSHEGEDLLWFTFSSRRDYGLRIRQEGRPRESQVAQLWMAAFRPGRAGSGDASSPAFWLPFQDPRSGNHVAQWAEQVRRQSCTSDADCAMGERCDMLAARVCVGR